MTPLPLTQHQIDGLDALVTSGKLVRVAVDVRRAQAFLGSATAGIADIDKVSGLNAKSRHRLAYDAAHDSIEALMAGYGFKTKGQGAHQSLAAAVQLILDAPLEVAAAAASFDSIRQKRNNDHYTAAAISEADATRAIGIARRLLEGASARLV